MPQLDKVHFFSQYFWLCVFYFGFYFLIVKHFLPRMARILQFRKNKCTPNSQENADRELSLVKESGNTALENVFSTSHKFWSHNTKRMDNWYGDKVSSLNNDYLKECNMLYIKKVGDYSLSQNAALAGIQLARPLGCYTWFLAGKLKQSPTTVFSSKPSFSSQSHTESKPHTKKVSKKRFNPDSQSNQGSSNGSDFGSQKKTKKSKTK